MPQGEQLERKQVTLLEAKAGDDGHGWLEGYASVKNNVDSYGDVIVDGAYKNLDQFIKSGWSGFNHEGVVGTIETAFEDAKGLFVRVAFHSDEDSQKVRIRTKERLERGKDVGMSILYQTLEASRGEREGKEVRELKAIAMAEAGCVTLPANVAATVAAVKSGSGTRLDDEIGAVLELAGDLQKRFVALGDERKNGLSDERKADVRAIAKAMSELADSLTDEPEPTTMATEDQVAELAASLVAAGVI